MRAFLDRVYDAAAWLAALCMIGVLIAVLLGVGGRLLNFHVPGTDAYAGYLMAGAGFLAMAHTFKKGEHIRVNLVLQAVGARANRALELWSHAAAVLLSGLFAAYSVKLAVQSKLLNDVSTANDATPLWIPQIAMAVGTVLLFVAFIDDFVAALKGTRVEAAASAPLHNE